MTKSLAHWMRESLWILCTFNKAKCWILHPAYDNPKLPDEKGLGCPGHQQLNMSQGVPIVAKNPMEAQPLPAIVCQAEPGMWSPTPHPPFTLGTVKRQSLKVQINATDDTVCMRYLRSSQSTKLEGFVLGYGSNFFSNQYIPLPAEGKNYITELGRNKTQKPLQLVVGTLSPTSVFLSWGILVNPQHDWTATSNCASDRFYTVRYREKGKDKKWVFQLCPATETVIDNLKPNTPYEFGVKDNAEDSIWSKTLNHKTVLSGKKVNGQLQNMYKLVPNSQTQIILSGNKKLVPVTIIKQMHLIVPGLNESQQKLPPLLTIDDIPQASRKKLAKNETGVWPAESKTPEVQEISPQSLPAFEEKQTVSSGSKPSGTMEVQPTRSAFDENQHISSRPETCGIQAMPSALPASLDSNGISFLSQTSASAEISKTETVFSGVQPVLSSPVAPSKPEIAEAGPAPKETQRVPSKPKTSPKPLIPQAKDVPREPQHVPSKPRTSLSPEVPRTKPASKDTYHRPSKPKTSPSPRVPPTRAKSLPTFDERDTTMIPDISEKTKATFAIYPTTPQLIITKSSTTTGPSRATMAPKETLLIPSKPKTSVGPEAPQTKPDPNETYHISPRPKIGQATEIPWFDTAFSRTTLAPARTKAPGLPKWIVPTTDYLYTPEATARPIDMGVKRPPEYADTWQKPISVTTSPGPQHPPIPPARPTQIRRKPLPPNTVTGKPGSPAKPAGPTSPVRTGTLHKTPTAFATPEYYVDATVFSSSPTSETDSSGKPRYQAPHVKYMKKDDDVPCSITSSLEHFPQEEVGSKEEPTRPPQNPPTNLTVVTVEGCPSFVILDWEKPDNDTVTEYEVVSTENGGTDGEKEKSVITTNQTHSTVENLKPDTSYEFHVKPRNPLGEGPSSNVVAFSTESADPRVSEPISMGKDAIWTEIPFNSDTYSECKGKQYVKRTWYKKFVGVQLCNSLRYKIYLSDSLTGKFYNIGDQRGHGEDHCQFVDSFLDGRTGQQEDLPVKDGFFRAVRQEPVKFGKIGGETQINYVRWYECGTSIPGKW
ncbi:ABI family member 3 binding protein [Turdus rufiventris]|nr:ABI family member 3 binding protein [Turdus rufiventris]